MLVAKQQTTQAGYEVTWRSLHEREGEKRSPMPSTSAARRRPAAQRRGPTASQAGPVAIAPVEPAERPSPPPERRRWTARRLRPRLGLLMRVSLAALCIVGLTLGYLAQQAVHTELVYERQRLQNRVDALAADVERLALEGDRLASLDRVASVAKRELGMQEPNRIARIPVERLNGEASEAIQIAMGIDPHAVRPANGVSTEVGGPGNLSGVTQVAWNRVSRWFSEWVGISMAEAHGTDVE